MELDQAVDNEIIPRLLRMTVRETCPWALLVGGNPRPAPVSIISTLYLVSRDWRAAVEHHVEYAALRLANWDFQQLQGFDWMKEDISVRAQYDEKLARFSKSWVTMIPLTWRMQTMSLKNLTVVELAQLRDILQDGRSNVCTSRDEAGLHPPAHIYRA